MAITLITIGVLFALCLLLRPEFKVCPRCDDMQRANVGDECRKCKKILGYIDRASDETVLIRRLIKMGIIKKLDIDDKDKE
jgi:hypothetical protein